MSTIDNPSNTTAVAQLPGTLRLGPVHLTVSDLDRSIAFYLDLALSAAPRRGRGAKTSA